MIPEHYSRDIAVRCQSLIRALWPFVQRGLPEDERCGGTLTNTFLLALATPMIVLPIERIFKPSNPNADQVGDDRELDPALAEEVCEVLGTDRPFGAAPFTVPGRWSYAARYRPFSISNQSWPEDLLEWLDAPGAFHAANAANAGRILCDLRNALAHGGVAYLDAHGRQTESLASMFAFAGAVKAGGRLIGINVLRVRRDDFYAFLMAWADWLAQPRVRAALNESDPLETTVTNPVN